MPWFPTVEWYEEFRDEVNQNRRFRELIDDWGEEFNGDFMFELRDIPIDEYTLEDIPDEMLTVDKMPDEIWLDIPEALENEMKREEVYKPIYKAFPLIDDSVRAELNDDLLALLEESEALFAENPTYEEVPVMISDELRDFLPPHLESLLYQLENFVNDDRTAYAYMSIDDGEVKDAEPLRPSEADERDPGFHLYGDYDDWEYFMKTDETVIGVVMDERLTPIGEMLKLMEYSDALNEMGKTRHDVEARFIFDEVDEDEIEDEDGAKAPPS